MKLSKAYLYMIFSLLIFSSGGTFTVSAASNLIHYDSKALEAVKSEIAKKNPFFVNAYNDLIKAANSEVGKAPNPVTNKTQTPPSGSKNDYLSLAPYWWPDPKKNDGLPWIWRDGQVNPMTRGNNTDLVRLRAFFSAMEILSLAYYFSDDKKYADKTIELLNVWLVDSKTRVNPHARFAQGIPGRNTGRQIGIIEWSNFSNVMIATQVLEDKGVLPATTKTGVNKWLSEWSVWLRTSDFGKKEAAMGNNHGTKYDYQVLGLLLYEGKTADATKLANDFKTKRIAKQIQPDGKQPSELSRTKSVNYSTMNLKAMSEVALLARHVNVDLWAYRSSDGRSMRKAYDFLRPYVLKQKKWTWKQISNGGAENALETLTKPMFSIGSTIFNEDLLPQSAKAGDRLSYLDKLRYPPRERLIVEGGGSVTPPPPTYSLNTSVTGQGTVVKSPDKTNYDPGTEVTLTATPATGMEFSHWSGGATGTDNPLTVTMNANRTVNAFFTPVLPEGIKKLSIIAAEASAEQNDDHLKEFSYDGDPQTRWANDNTSDNNWIIFDLGEPGVINVIKLMLNVGETRTYPLKVEVGESTENFTEVWKGDLPPAIGLNTIVVTEATGRYLKVSMTGPNSDGSNWFSIFQTEVWGKSQGTFILSPSSSFMQSVNFNQIKGGFIVTAPGASAKLEVFDLKGKLLFQKSGVFQNSFIPIRQSGVYFLRFSKGDRQINRRLVIQN